MPTHSATRDLDDLKLSLLALLSALSNGAQVKLALASGCADCDINQVLDALTDGGEIQLTFAAPSHRETIQGMKKALKQFERGILTENELFAKLWSYSQSILDALEESSDEEQGLLAAEMHRALCLLPDPSELCQEFDFHKDDTNSIVPARYVLRRCSCFITLMESLACPNDKDDMTAHRGQIATLLAVRTTSESILVTDGLHRELLSHEIDTIVHRGGTMTLSALPSADAMLLSDIQQLINDWHWNRLRNRTLCRRLRAHLTKLNAVDPAWWDAFYATLRELWIVAFGRCPKRARASITEKAARDDIHSLLDEIEQLVHAPLSPPAPALNRTSAGTLAHSE